MYLNLIYFFGNNQNIYLKSDYFINYSSGFIRRGLDGQIIYYISRFTGFPPILSIKIYYSFFFCAFIVIIGFVNLKKWKKLPLYYLISPFLLLPSLLYFRKLHLSKDLEIIVLGFLLIYFFEKKRNFFITNTLMILGTMVHEVFFFLIFFPLLMMYQKNKEKLSIKIVFSFFMFIFPSIITVLSLVTIFSGLDKDISKIFNSWSYLDSSLLGKIRFNSGLFKSNEIRYVYTVINGKINYIGILITLILNFLFFYLLKFEKKQTLLLILQTMVISFLILIASDYYRWFLIANFFYIFYLKFDKIRVDIKFSVLVYCISGMPYVGWNIYRYLDCNPIYILTHLKSYLLI